MIVLGIETSCDETGIALYDSNSGRLTHAIYSQTEIHAPYGGVVPELASRDHIRKILPLVKEVFTKANLHLRDIQAIAYTGGPGLIGALLVGASFARSLGWALSIPTLAVHHLEGHLLSPMLTHSELAFPFLALLVSGGHTLLVKAKKVGNYEVLGETLDDAAGETFDKIAKLLGFPYPGGPQLAILADKGNPHRFRFPRPMIENPNLDFSFSGLKTCAATTFKKSGNDRQTKADIAYALQEAIVETLTIKCRRALEKTGLSQLVLAGGVSANQRLRQKLLELTQKLSCRLFYPPLELCTDNGAMIAYAGYARLASGQKIDDLFIHAKARWPLDSFNHEK